MGVLRWIAPMLFPLLSFGAEFKVAEGMKAEPFLDYPEVHAFTWDEHAALWMVSGHENRLVLSKVAQRGVVQPIGSFARRGNERASVLVHGGKAFVSDGESIRRFELGDGRHINEESALVLSPELFPRHAQIHSLYWSPLGHIWFQYETSEKDEVGFGRVHPRQERWDVVAKGLRGDLAFDVIGFPIATDELSGEAFRLGLGLDYGRGLENFTKKDVALRLDRTGLKPGAVSSWPDGTNSTVVFFDSTSSTLQQFRDEGDRFTFSRELAQWEGAVAIPDLQLGPDGALWVLVEKSQDATALYRLVPGETAGTIDVAGLPTKEVAGLLKGDSSWQRETALRVLEDRNDLRHVRGLHPGTPLHDIYNDRELPTLPRLLSVLALHRAEVLDETMIENVMDEKDPVMRTWGTLLFGERNYPTGTAFQMIMKAAKETNLVVRTAAAVAARQFVSGALAVDTPPRAMPIREVFTGGILSTLWFSTEKSSSPAFELHFWNAVRPISAYDSAHPLGFFNGDREEGLPVAYWMISLITRQVAEQDDPLKQEDAMLMLGELKSSNARMMVAALEGLKKGTPQRRVAPTAKSLEVLGKLSRKENCAIAGLAAGIYKDWSRAFIAGE